MGEVAEAADPLLLLARFTRRHPSAERYAGFADFRLYRLQVARAHLVAGFGRIDWIEAASLLSPPPRRSPRRRRSIPAHMNADHAGTIDLDAERLLGLAGAGWRLTGVDPEGADLRRGGCIGKGFTSARR